MPPVLDILNREDRPPMEFCTNIPQELGGFKASTAFGFTTLEVILTDVPLGGTDTLALPVPMMAPCPNVVWRRGKNSPESVVFTHWRTAFLQKQMGLVEHLDTHDPQSCGTSFQKVGSLHGMKDGIQKIFLQGRSCQEGNQAVE